MIIISPLFAMGIKVVGLTAIAVILYSANNALATTQLAMIGQQYFPDGTGIAYFNDGTTQEFEHRLTEDEGYYFDESTQFYIGAVPGVGNNTDSVVCEDLSAVDGSMLTSTRDNNSATDGANITNVTIIRGASILEDKSRAIDPSPIITIKVNDTVRWINEDANNFWLTLPPLTGGNGIPDGTIIPRTILNENGGSLVCTFSEPSGFHYTLRPFDDPIEIKGAVIVADEDTTNNTSTEQHQEPPSSLSPFSQQLQSDQIQEQQE